MCQISRYVLYLDWILSGGLVYIIYNVQSTGHLLGHSKWHDVTTLSAYSTHIWTEGPSQTNATSCDGDFSDVLNVHLNTTVLIGYYGYHRSDLTQFGGAEWSVMLTEWVVLLTGTGNVIFCLSGMAVDATYQLACTYINETYLLAILLHTLKI